MAPAGENNTSEMRYWNLVKCLWEEGLFTSSHKTGCLLEDRGAQNIHSLRD